MNILHKNSNTLKISAALFILIAVVFLNACGSSSAPEPLKDRDLVIKISDISDKARFYPVEIGATKLEVIAVKAPDNTIRTAFNTCQVCFGSGRGYYVQSGKHLVCQNCGNRFAMSEIEVA